MTGSRALRLSALAIAIGVAHAAAAQVAPVSAVNKPVERRTPVAPLTESATTRAAPAGAEASLGGLGSRLAVRAGGRDRILILAARRALLGAGLGDFGWSGELFGPASRLQLDRIAFAVDGAESSHGTDPRMWRPEPSGPQGPMQVSLAAAVDVGGGDRFDFWQNRLLGRAYLAHLFQRYGNWPDAVAAYNWGPGNLETWAAAGRPASRLPFGVGRYVERVLRDAALGPYARPLGFAAAAPVAGLMLADYSMWGPPTAKTASIPSRQSFGQLRD